MNMGRISDVVVQVWKELSTKTPNAARLDALVEKVKELLSSLDPYPLCSWKQSRRCSPKSATDCYGIGTTMDLKKKLFHSAQFVGRTPFVCFKKLRKLNEISADVCKIAEFYFGYFSMRFPYLIS